MGILLSDAGIPLLNSATGLPLFTSDSGVALVQASTAALFNTTTGIATTTLSGVTLGNSILVLTFGIITKVGGGTVSVAEGATPYPSGAQQLSTPVSGVFSIIDASLLTNVASGTHTITSTMTAGATAYHGRVVAYETTPASFDVESVKTVASSFPSTAPTAPIANTNALSFAAFCAYYDNASTITRPSGFANLLQLVNGLAGGTSPFCVGSIDCLAPLTAGAQPSVSWGSPANYTWASLLVVLKPSQLQNAVGYSGSSGVASIAPFILNAVGVSGSSGIAAPSGVVVNFNATGVSGSAGVASLQQPIFAVGFSGSTGVVTPQIVLFGAGSGSLGVVNLFSLTVPGSIAAAGASGSLGVTQLTTSGALVLVGNSGSQGIVNLTPNISPLGLPGFSGSYGIATLATSTAFIQGTGFSGSLGIASAFPPLPPPIPPYTCTPLWDFSGKWNWDFSGYPGWSFDGYEPTPLQCAVQGLASVGVNVGTLTYVCSNTVPNGWVITGWLPFMNPSYAGQYIPLTVSNGPCILPTPLTVPYVVGMFYYDAQLAILDAGFETAYPTWALSTTVLPQYVISQSLPAGTIVTVQTQISIVVSGFPVVNQPNTVVPVP